ncbi:diguanylate cyclase [Haloimpatiens sp. FM7330]|uniref:histidine kinase N-terminal 7TM domain-containing diguanylate cyclase n=1 Tax=Haloimpatiens sp. FM7330 TaxID=3298610 RepID=UPI0036408CB9
MNWQALPYTIPLCITLIFSILIIVYIFKYKLIPGVEFLIIMALIMVLWSFGYIFEVLSKGLEQKIFWDNIQMLTGALGTACFGFALQYTRQKSRLKFKEYFLLAIEPVTIWILAVSNYTNLFRENARMYTGGPIPALIYDLNSASWFDLTYGYIMYFLFVVILIKFFIRTHSLYRKQLIIILFGVSIAALGLILFLLGLTPKFMRDPVPVTFTILNISIAFSIYRYKFLNVVPIAREVIFEKLNMGLIVLDTNKIVIDINLIAKNIINSNTKNIIGHHINEVLNNLKNIFIDLDHTKRMKSEITIEKYNKKFVYDVKILPILKKDKIHIGWIMSFEDISERKRLEKALQASEEKYRNVSEFANDGIAIVQNGSVKYVNKKLSQILKSSYEEIVDSRFEEYIVPELRSKLKENYKKRLEGKNVDSRYEAILLCKDRSTLEVEVNAAVMNYNGSLATLAYIRDITERKRAEKILEELATKDVLTHIFNRRHFFILAEKEFGESIKNNICLYAIMIDIDYFKNVNDRYGHAIGDKVLCSIANSIKNSIRKTDLCCRYGGEEFAVLLPKTCINEARVIAERIRKNIMSMYVNTEKGKISVTASLGGAGILENSEDSIDKLFDRADKCMYDAKNSGRNKVVMDK